MHTMKPHLRKARTPLVLLGTLCGVLSLASSAKAAVALSLTDNVGTPNSADVNLAIPGSRSFSFTVNLTSTEGLTGLTYLFDAPGSGSGQFQLTARNTTGAIFSGANLTTDDATVLLPGNALLDPRNNGDLGGTVADPNSECILPGTHFVATLTLEANAAIPAGLYTLQTALQSATGCGPIFNEISMPLANYTVHVVSDIPVWSGALGSEWSTNVLAAPKNWVRQSNNALTTDFVANDTVIFNDFAATTVVNVSAADVTPFAVEFDNPTKNYTVTGTKAITGPATLTKRGNATLTINNTNSFTGAVFLNGGVLSVSSVANSGANSPLGAGSNFTFDGGILQFTGVSGTTNRAISLTGDGTISISALNNNLTLSGPIAGSGSLIKDGPGTLTLTSTNSYTGSTLIRTRALVASAPGGNALPGNVTLGSIVFDNAFLRMGASNQFGPNSVLTFNGGNAPAKFELRGFNQTVAGLSSDADDVVSIIQNDESGVPTAATLTINNTGNYVFNGIIRTSAPGAGGALNLLKSGAGTQEIRNVPAQGFNFGSVSISMGKLTFNLSGPTATLGAGTSVAIATAAQLGLDGTWNMNREISGAGTVTKTGTGSVTISGPQSYAALVTQGGTTTLTSSLPNATITNTTGTLILNADATGSTVNVAANTCFGDSQDLAALNISSGGIATISALGKSGSELEEPDWTNDAIVAEAAWQGQLGQSVPEPGVMIFLALGMLRLLGSRRGKARGSECRESVSTQKSIHP
jgi:autotransporter-associated beta strand protein